MNVTSAPACFAPSAAIFTSFLLNESFLKLPAKASILTVEGIFAPCLKCLVPRSSKLSSARLSHGPKFSLGGSAQPPESSTIYGGIKDFWPTRELNYSLRNFSDARHGDAVAKFSVMRSMPTRLSVVTQK